MLSINEKSLVPEVDEKEMEISCDKHGLSKAKSFYFGGKWSSPVCKHCKADEVAYHDETTKANDETQRKAEFAARVEKMLRLAEIPKRYQGVTIDTSPNAIKAQAYVNEFAAVMQTGRSIGLCGTVGSGKTHIACWIIEQVIRRYGAYAVFTNAMDIIRRVKETYNPNSPKTEREVLAQYVGYDLLVVDEIGIQFGSQHEKIMLFEIFNKRYAEVKPTMLISNLTPDEMKNYIGESIADRFRQCGGGMWLFTGESRRSKV